MRIENLKKIIQKSKSSKENRRPKKPQPVEYTPEQLAEETRARRKREFLPIFYGLSDLAGYLKNIPDRLPQDSRLVITSSGVFFQAGEFAQHYIEIENESEKYQMTLF